MIDYDKLDEVEVHDQKELDDIPDDYKGYIIIVGNAAVIVSKKYYQFVRAYDSSTVRAYNSSTVTACDSSTVRAYNSSTVTACDSSTVRAYDSSTVRACGSSTVTACDSSTVRAYNSSTVTACDSSTVTAYDSSTVRACGSSTVTACDSSTVRACGSSTVRACGYAQVICRRSTVDNITVNDQARIINLTDVDDFLVYYDIRLNRTKTKARFFKAVHKVSDKYLSDYDKKYEYIIGRTKSGKCDPDIFEDCGEGIHIAPFFWAREFGKEWDDLAILEVETRLSDIVIPLMTTGKVRTSQIKVLREVPREEWSEIK